MSPSEISRESQLEDWVLQTAIGGLMIRNQTNKSEYQTRILSRTCDGINVPTPRPDTFLSNQWKGEPHMKLASQLLRQIADPSHTLSEKAYLQCQLARHLEETGNYEAAREALADLWEGVGNYPVLEGLDQPIAAEVLLRAGVLTGWIGSCKQVEGSQENAKNLIGACLQVLEDLKDQEKIAEAEMEIAYCYWREGGFNESRDLLAEALRRLSSSSSPVRVIALLRAALLAKVSNKLSDALKLLMEAAPLLELGANDTIKGRFHNEYAQVLRKLSETECRDDYVDRALIEYAAASYHFEQAGHTRYQAYVENNLGFLYGTLRNFANAHIRLDRAQALFTSLKDKSHLAQVDDTRARVFLNEGRETEAAKFAYAAVQALDGGDQQALLAEALTTLGIALARLGLHKNSGVALQRAVEVAQVAGDLEDAGLAELSIIEELGPHLTLDELSVTYDRALELLSGSRNPATKERLLNCAQRVLYLSGIIPTPPSWENFHIKDALHRYEARIIERALKESGRSVTRAARMLGFRNHTSLIKKLNTWHENLLSERAPIRQRRQSLMFLNASGETELQPVAILHVEDNLLVADAVKAALELEGWSVETVQDGATAAQLLESDVPFDAVILDNDLPGITGLELINHLRCLAHRQNIPLIMLTASDVEKEARQQGVNAFLKKPEDVMAVTETIARLLARKLKAK